MALVRYEDGSLCDHQWLIAGRLCDLDPGGKLVAPCGTVVEPPPESKRGLSALEHVNGEWILDLKLSV
jgi:hypothetical protein